MEKEEGNKGYRPQVKWADVGLLPYQEALRLQERAREWIRESGEPGWVVFTEHPPTITLGYSLRGDEGRSALRKSRADLEAEGITVVEVDRGGKATYHGPGQVVGYPVLNLKELRVGVKRYVGLLMETVMEVLRETGVEAELDPAYPGVWCRGAKVAAVGIRVQDRVSTHGFAINLNPDLTPFSHIIPCGIADRPVTSLARLLDRPVTREELICLFVRQMEEKFKIELLPESPENLRLGENKEEGECRFPGG